jgi:hypothetical protein
MPQNPMNIFLAAILAVTLSATAAFAQPATQPTTQPDEKITVPEEDLARIREAAILAETANAAGLEWKPYYVAFMKLERRKDWTDKQIKFIGMYFGAIQGHFEDELSQKKYTQDEVRTLKEKLEKETARLNREATTRPYRKRSE